jgi:signal transduction histidine kinase
LRLVGELDRGSMELRADPIRVDDVVRGLLPTMQALAEPRSVRVEADIAPALPRVPADRMHLQEALSILLRSAVNRSPDGSTVRVTVESTNGVVRLTMTHGGVGTIPPLERALVERLARSMNLTFAEASDATTVEFSTKR